MTNTGINRRDLIKWGTFVGAALGLPHWKTLECLDFLHGKAYGATLERQTLPVVLGMAPNGGLAHYTQVWGTTPEVGARGANVPIHAPTTSIALKADSAGPMNAAPTYPFSGIPGLTQHATILACGSDETHTNQQNQFGPFRFSPTVYFPALVTAAQSIDNFTLPQVVVGNPLVGTAPGQLPSARAASSDAFANLFTKTLSKAGKALESAKAAQNSPMFKAAFTTYARLLYASGVNRDRVDYQTGQTLFAGKTGTELLAQNLGTVLQPTTEELTRYGVNVQGVDTVLVNLAKALITFKKSVERNLTGSLVVQAAPGNDPHGAFQDQNGTPEMRLTWTTLGTIWKQFTTDMMAGNQHFVAAITGDTAKSVVNLNGWGDGSSQAGDLTLMFAMDTSGHLRDGVFGAYGPGIGNRMISFNAATGAPDPAAAGPPAATAALSALTSAIVRKNSNRPAGVTLSNIAGLVRPRLET